MTKIRSANSGAKPMPLSLTSNRQAFSSGVTVSCTRGAASPRNLMALPIRFCSSWVSCEASPVTVGKVSHTISAPLSSMTKRRLASARCSETLASMGSKDLPWVPTRE